MDIVIGPVLRRADGYRFDTWAAGEGMTQGYPYCRIEDAHYARNTEIKDQGVCAGSRPVRDRLPDPRRVHREIHRIRDACGRLTGFMRRSRRTPLGPQKERRSPHVFARLVQHHSYARS